MRLFINYLQDSLLAIGVADSDSSNWLGDAGFEVHIKLTTQAQLEHILKSLAGHVKCVIVGSGSALHSKAAVEKEAALIVSVYEDLGLQVTNLGWEG